MPDPQTEAWLRELPIDTPVDIDGVTVWLNVRRDGAELGARLLESFTEPQLQDVLRYGFQSALEFDAGFALSADGASLNLSQWLPGVRDWVEAMEPLEKLLNQVDGLQDYAGPERQHAQADDPARQQLDRRMREWFERNRK